MAQDIVLTMDGLLINWLVDVGDSVNAGDIIAEFEADKATVEVEAEAAGTILELRPQPGDEVIEGATIAVIGAAEEALATSSPPVADTATSSVTLQPVTSPKKNSVSAKADGRIKISPLARNLASERGIDLSAVNGTGPGGRIVKVDVENFTPPVPQKAAATIPAATTYGAVPEGDQVEVHEIKRMRRAIADATILSKQQVPHFYVTMDMDVAVLLNLRKELNSNLADEGIKITVNDMIVKTAALVIKKFPNLNSHYYGDRIVRHKQINIGIAVALPNNGLLNVVAHDADSMALSALSVRNKEMIARAREGKVKPADIQGATFTVSNLGAYDVDHFSAIISPPEAAILAVGSAKQVPVVLEDGTLGIGNRMKVTISVDHRVSDGAEGAEFMRSFRDLIENPMRLLV